MDILFSIIGSVMIADTLQRSNNYAPVYYCDFIPGNLNAMTVPPIGIFIHNSQAGNEYLLHHELIHWKQYLDRGAIPFYCDYLIGSLRGYEFNPMEIEARELESDFVKCNYTFAVRNGIAKTVYNPNFRQ